MISTVKKEITIQNELLSKIKWACTLYLESDLEKNILEHLKEFLLELGKGFMFVGSQVRLTLEEDHFYPDLVFYNRLLKCFVIIDLKIGKVTHQDIGQMQMYVNYYDREIKKDDENPTVVFCFQH